MKNKHIVKIMDLIKILENTPVGTPLYSTVFGTLYFERVSCDTEYPIVCRISDSEVWCFTKDGKLLNNEGECILFPSEENRNWDNFVKPTFKPFDKVLVRDCNGDAWMPALFAYINNSDNVNQFCMINGEYWKQCILYEGNEHLLGTTKDV